MTQNDLGWPEVRIVQCWSCGICGTVYTFLQLFYNFFYTLFTSFSYPFYTIFTPLLNPVCTFLHHFYNLLPNPKSHHFFPQSEVWSTILQWMAQNRMRNGVKKPKTQNLPFLLWSEVAKRSRKVQKGPQKSKKSQKKIPKSQKKNPKKIQKNL